MLAPDALSVPSPTQSGSPAETIAGSAIQYNPAPNPAKPNPSPMKGCNTRFAWRVASMPCDVLSVLIPVGS